MKSEFPDISTLIRRGLHVSSPGMGGAVLPLLNVANAGEIEGSAYPAFVFRAPVSVARFDYFFLLLFILYPPIVGG